MTVVYALISELAIFMSFLLRTVRTKLSVCMSVILYLSKRNQIICDHQHTGGNYTKLSQKPTRLNDLTTLKTLS